MEKRISFFQFQSIKNVAKAIDPKLKERAALQRKAVALKAELDDKKARLQREIDRKTGALEAEFTACEQQINLLEAGIVQTLGFHVSDVVKKVVEPTGKTDAKTGKALTVTKYLPTDNVKYDEQTKEYIVSIMDSDAPTTEGGAASFQGADGDNAGEQPTAEPEDTEVPAESATESQNASELPWEG